MSSLLEIKSALDKVAKETLNVEYTVLHAPQEDKPYYRFNIYLK